MRMPNAILMGHLYNIHDSRGGSLLVINAPNADEAWSACVKATQRAVSPRVRKEVEVGLVVIQVYSTSLPEKGELLAQYGGHYQAIVIEDVGGDLVPPHNVLLLVGWDGPIVTRWTWADWLRWFDANDIRQLRENPNAPVLGEDAFGLWLIRYDSPEPVPTTLAPITVEEILAYYTKRCNEIGDDDMVRAFIATVWTDNQWETFDQSDLYDMFLTGHRGLAGMTQKDLVAQLMSTFQEDFNEFESRWRSWS